MMRNIGHHLLENPIPLALISGGVAWLVVQQFRRRSGDEFTTDYTRTRFSSDDRNMTGRVREAASAIGARASEGVRDVRSRVGYHTDRMGRQVSRTSKSFSQFVHDEPLVIGALAVGVGTVIGALLPPTDWEDEYLGPGRDDLLDEGSEMAEEIKEDITDVVETAYEAGKDEASRKFGGDGS